MDTLGVFHLDGKREPKRRVRIIQPSGCHVRQLVSPVNGLQRGTDDSTHTHPHLAYERVV